MKTIILLVILAASSLSHSALFIRDLDGDFSNGHEGAYDDILDITWVLDIGFHRKNIDETGWEPDNPSRPWQITNGSYITNYQDTNKWLSQLAYAGVNTWRLPKADPVNGESFQYGYENGSMDMLTDKGWGIINENNELSHLINVSLGNLGERDQGGVYRPAETINSGPFIDFHRNIFWAKGTGELFDHVFWINSEGRQQPTATYTRQDEGAGAVIIVTDGDVGIAVVPLPAGIWLFFSSLSIILCIKQCKVPRLKNKRGV